jgi:hypothetical protein
MMMRVPITVLLLLALDVMLVGAAFADCSTMPRSSRQHGSPCCPEHPTRVPQDKSCRACISASPVAPVNATLTEATDVGVALLDPTATMLPAVAEPIRLRQAEADSHHGSVQLFKRIHSLLI